jgi:hypothetical protein
LAESNGSQPGLVEWDLKSRELKPERSVAFVQDGKRGVVVSHDAKSHRVLVQYRSSLDSIDFEEWSLDPLERIRQFTVAGNISAGQLLSNDRVALVKGNGNVVILRAGPVSDQK